LPFESKAQQGFLEAHPEKVGGRAKLKEWERSTDFSHLPEHKHMAKKSHEFSYTTVHHHKDNSHTVHHHHESDPAKDIEHAVADHDGMMDSMQSNLGEPAGEAEAAGPAPGTPGAAPAAV
jgi:hypothetical protein